MPNISSTARIRIERRIASGHGAMGPETTWRADNPVFAQVTFVDAKALPQYQQVEGAVYWRVKFKGSMALTFKDTRFVWLTNGGKILIPEEPPHGVGNYTVILTREE